MDFDNKLPEWENEGVEPNESRIKTGFEAGFKPSASIFNWFWHKVTKAISELQTKFSGLSKSIDKIGTATSEDGATYTATIEGVTELYNGLKITIIPTMSNTNISPRLDINGLGDKAIRIAHSFNYAATNALKTNFLQEGRPVELKYDANCNLGVQGQGAWIFTDRVKTSAQDLYGTVPIESGGTDASDAETARANLGITPENIGAIPKTEQHTVVMTPTVLASEEAINSFYDNYSSNLEDRTRYEATVFHNASHSIFGGGLYYLFGVKGSGGYEWQEIKSYYSVGCINHFIRSRINGEWTAWGKSYNTGNKPKASDIGGGAFGGKVFANPTYTAELGSPQVRNINAGASDLTAGSSALETGCIYCVYE